MTPRIGSLCTGYGGLDMAVCSVLDGQLVWWSDIEPGPVKLMTEQHPGVPNLGDLKAVDWYGVEPVDILTAGYPCQPFSNAGKRLGLDDPRHLWPWVAHAIAILRPRTVVLENVAAHRRRGFRIVAGDLAALGYRISWTINQADHVGAPHERKRLFIVAVTEDTHVEPGDQRRWSASGQTEVRRAWTDAEGRDPRADQATAADTPSIGR